MGNLATRKSRLSNNASLLLLPTEHRVSARLLKSQTSEATHWIMAETWPRVLHGSDVVS